MLPFDRGIAGSSAVTIFVLLDVELKLGICKCSCLQCLIFRVSWPDFCAFKREIFQLSKATKWLTQFALCIIL